jgi:rhodanese-related sulfurtransferase
MRHWTPLQLKTYLDQNNQPLLLDVREPWEFEICHIAGSQLIPMSKIPQNINTFNRHQEIVLICHHGIRSRQVGYFLESQGLTDLINLTGGVEAWARDVDFNMATY